MAIILIGRLLMGKGLLKQTLQELACRVYYLQAID
jgi:hypothetical protein